MVGFAGYISQCGGNMEKMLNAVSPNGFKTTREYSKNCCSIGIAALSEKFNIGDIIYKSANGLAVAFSGKIYNYARLKDEIGVETVSNDDAELIALGYMKFGTDIAKKIKGMFAFAIYDEAENSIVIARDGCGMRSMYYCSDEQSFAFASNTRGFEGLNGFKKEFNEKLLSAFLCYGSVPTKETFIKNVYRLEPGHILTFKNGKIEKDCFWSLDFNEQDKTEEEFIDEIHQAVTDSVGYHCNNENFATFLSSGVDSSYIASIAKPKTTYTAGYASSKYDESIYTKELAEALGIENKVRIITPEEYLEKFEEIIYAMDEPLSNPSVPSIYFGASAVAEDGKDIIISGEGADELFGGYNSYKEEISHSSYMKLPYFVRHLVYLATKWIPSAKLDFFARRGQKLSDYHIGLDRIFKDKEAVALTKTDEWVSTKKITAEYYAAYENCSTMKQRQAIDFYFWLINDFIHCVARSAEKFGIQARFPLLGAEVIDVSMQLPDRFKLMGGMTKALFRKASKKVIPTEAHSRKKLGFPVPLKDWLKREDFYLRVKEKFQSDTANKFFQTESILKLLDDHKNGVSDCYKKIWTIYTFILWYELNFEN